MKFKVTLKDFFEENKDRAADVLFRGLSDGKILSEICKYVCLTWDYYSPLHENPINMRQRQAVRFIYPNITEEEISQWLKLHAELIKKVKERFKEFQYDLECESYLILVDELENINREKKRKTKTDIDDAIKFAKELPKILATKRELEVLLKYRLQMLEEDKNMGKEVNAIDRMHNNNREKLMNED